MTLFDPSDAYGRFIHAVGSGDHLEQFPDDCPSPCTNCDDVGVQVYAPYLVPSWFKATATDLTVYYTLSTGRPYQVLLMKSVLSIACWG
jgi:hypothetical protein